jgi:hypothetical protein
MSRKPYPNDLTDQEWALLEPLIPAAKRGGRPRTVNMREVLSAIIYVLKTGCQWDHFPHDMPPKGGLSLVQHVAQGWGLAAAVHPRIGPVRGALRYTEDILTNECPDAAVTAQGKARPIAAT